MKFLLFSSTILAILANASAGVSPELSLTVKDGNFGNVKTALTPKLSVGGDVGSGVEVGADLDVDLDFLGSAKSVWATKTLDVSGFSVKAKAEYSEGKYDYGSTKGINRGVYLSLEANDEDETLFAWASGDISPNNGVQPLKIGGKKIFETGKGKFMVEPRCRFYSGTTEEGPDICLGYQPSDDTSIYVTASQYDQNVKIVQTINADNTGSVKFGVSSGFDYAQLENDSDLGKSTLTVTKGAVDVQLEQDGWKAGMTLSYPLQKAEPQVRFSKKFTVGKA